MENIPWSFLSHLGLGLGILYLNFCSHFFLPSPGTLSNTREMGALLYLNSPGVLPSGRKGQGLSLFPTTSPRCCARLLHPSSAGLSSSAHICEQCNITAFPFALPVRTHFLQTWHISTGSPCLLTTSAPSLSFMSHLKSLTLTPNLSCLRCTLRLSCFCHSPLRKVHPMGAQMMICAGSKVRR